MTDAIGWIIILGALGIMLAIDYVPWWIWVLVIVMGIAIVGCVKWVNWRNISESENEE